METSEKDFGSLLGGTSVVFTGFVLQTGLVFLIRVAFARYLSVESFGLLALFMALVNVSGILAVGGLNVGIGRYLPRFQPGSSERGDVVRSALEVAIPLSVSLGLGIYLASEWLAGEVFRAPSLASFFVVAAVATPFYGVQQIALGAARGQEQTVPKVLIENVIVPVSQLLFAVPLLIVGVGTLGIAWAYAGGFVVSGIIGAGYVLTRSPIRFGRRGTMHRQLVRFSAPLVVTGMLFQLIHYLDSFLLGYFSTPSSVGIYNTVYPLSLLVTVFLVSFVFLLLPAVSSLDVDDEMDRADHLFKLTSKWIVFLTFPIFLAMFYFPEFTISVTFGAKYAAGASALSVLVVGFLIHTALGATDKGLIAIGKTRLVMMGNISAAIVNVVLNVLLIPTYGFFGAAVASVLAFWTLDVVWLALLHRHTGIFPISSGLARGITISAIVTGLVCGGLGRLVAGSPVGIVTVLLFAGVLHLLIVIRYGNLTDEELAFVSQVEAEIGHDLSPIRRSVRRIRL